MSRTTSPRRPVTSRQPCRLTPEQVRTLYARLEEPSAPPDRPWTLYATFFILLAGLALGWLLGP